MKHALTCFEYMYRDAGNYKAFGEVWLSGFLSYEEKDFIFSTMESGEFFVAEQIGVPALYQKLYVSSGGPTKDDHTWHTYQEFRENTFDAVPAGIQIWGNTQAFLKAFESVVRWDIALSPHFHL
jgi:hypothetical protein